MTRRWLGLGTALLMLGSAAGLHLLSKAKCFQLVGDVVCRIETDHNVVALTFDDGPTPEGVDAVLAVLEEHDVKATFFLIGNRMERYPNQAKRLLSAAHELGNHTYSHKRNLFRSQSFYDDEVKRARDILQSYGSETTLFRPPFGKRIIGLPWAVDEAGYTTIMWDVANKAETFPAPEDYAADIVDRVEPGSIILMHPMYHHNQTARDALPLVIRRLRAGGFEIVTSIAAARAAGGRGLLSRLFLLISIVII